MPLLIDVYNVLHVTGILPPELAGLDVTGLRDLIAVSRYRRTSATLVCDGHAPGRPRASGRGGAGVRPVAAREDDADVSVSGHAAIVYAGSGRDADSVIMQAIHTHSAPRRLIVVSSDRRIQRAARKRRCAVLAADEFLRRLVFDCRRRPAGDGRTVEPRSYRLDPASVQYWRRHFGLPETTEDDPPTSAPSRDETPTSPAPNRDAMTRDKDRDQSNQSDPPRRLPPGEIDIDTLDTGRFLPP